VKGWIGSIGLALRVRPAFSEAHPDRPAHEEHPRDSAAAQHSKLESTVRTREIEVDDALKISEQTEI
jgi:hypothetical protein